jgi:predicted membrane protein
MTTNLNVQPEGTEPGEYARIYYQHQYERLSKLEDQRLAITNIVMTISTGALAFGFSDVNNLSLINGVGLPLMIIFSNLFAIAYIIRSRDFMETHKQRARKVLELKASELSQIDQAMKWPERKWFRNRTRIQVSFHVVLMLTALLPVGSYLKKIL